MTFNPAILASDALKWIENTETVTVTRRTPSGGVQNITTIYSGKADIQYFPGNLTYDPSGAVTTFDAEGFIDAVAGVLPAIKSGDFLQIGTGDQFTILTVEPYNLAPIHLELKLKRGGINYGGGGGHR